MTDSYDDYDNISPMPTTTKILFILIFFMVITILYFWVIDPYLYEESNPIPSACIDISDSHRIIVETEECRIWLKENTKWDTREIVR